MKEIKPTEGIKTLSGVDALYYQLSLNYNNYSIFYKNVLLKKLFENYNNLVLLSNNLEGQYITFDLLSLDDNLPEKIARIRFKNLCTTDFLESVSIQHYTTYMNVVGYEKAYNDVLEFIKNLGLIVQQSKIQRIDLNSYVFNVDLDFLEYDYFQTLSRKNTNTSTSHFNQLNKTTFTIGSRTGKSPYLRIYDKRAELIANDKDTSKQAMIKYRYLMKFNKDIELMEQKFYNVEFELKREALKAYSIETVEEALEKSYHIMNDIMLHRVRLLSRKKSPGEKNLKRIDTHHIWEQIRKEYLPDNENYDITKLKTKKYTKDEQWLLNRVKEYKKENPKENPFIMAKIRTILRDL